MSAKIVAAQKDYEYLADSTLTVLECPICYITYAIPASMREDAIEHPWEDKNTVTWHCPNGHVLGVRGISREQKLERQLDASHDHSAYLRSRLDQTEASRRAQKAATTRARNERDKILGRIKNGVCPCCNRSFINVRRHMTRQHPDYEVPDA